MSSRPGCGTAIAIVVVAAFALNYFVRVGGSGDDRSTGIVVEWIGERGLVAAVGAGAAAVFVVYLAMWVFGFARGATTPGVMSFWRLMAKHPDLGYEWLSESDAWQVLPHPLPSDYLDIVPSAEWEGPFDLYVPSEGRRVKIFGRIGAYEDSREDFIDMIETLNS